MTEYEKALQYTLRLLAARDYLKKQLEIKLKRREVTPEVIEQVLNRLDELGYLDDQGFIAGFIRGRILTRDGPYKIARKLQERGCSRSDIDDALLGYSREQQYNNLVSIISSKRRLDRRKLINHCRNRGYGYDLISEVIDDLGFFS